MTIRIVPARIDAAGALKRFQRKRWGNLFGLLRPRPARVDGAGQVLSLEQVWMPAYAYQFSMMHRGKAVQSWVSVDASFGGFALFGRVKELIDQQPEGEIFEPVLGPDQCEAIAREGVVRYILRTRGAKPAVDDIVDRRFFHAPVWVYYFRTWGGKLNLAVRDAYTGDPMGGLVKRAIVDGFIAKRKRGNAIKATE